MPTTTTPTAVFDALLQEMSNDNGFKFEVLDEQRARAEAAIALLLAEGWDPKNVTDGIEIDESYEYGSDIEILASGEESDKNAVVAAWGAPMVVVDRVLNEVFDQ